jgi:hypothetical protein
MSFRSSVARDPQNSRVALSAAHRGGRVDRAMAVVDNMELPVTRILNRILRRRGLGDELLVTLVYASESADASAVDSKAGRLPT